MSLEWKKDTEKNWHQPPGERGGKEELLVVRQEALGAKWGEDVCSQRERGL